MKFRHIISFLALAASLHAQEVGEIVPPPEEELSKNSEAPDNKPSKPSPPRAQVIEEDTPADTVDPLDAKASDIPVAESVTDGADGDPMLEKPAALDAPVGEDDAIAESDVEEKSANEGIQIQVEKVSGRSGDSSELGEVKISSPWPAKPLDEPPLGWRYIPAPEGIDPYRTTVKLGESSSVNLAITPYVLVPVSDGRNVIRISEPGYQPELSYLQNQTVGAILQHSTEKIEQQEKLTGAAIQRLQQLLSSLPKP
jgi:hypothetical protein